MPCRPTRSARTRSTSTEALPDQATDPSTAADPTSPATTTLPTERPVDAERPPASDHDRPRRLVVDDDQQHDDDQHDDDQHDDDHDATSTPPTAVVESTTGAPETTQAPVPTDVAVVEGTTPVERAPVPVDPEIPVEETTTTTTIPVSLPPVNPIWLQTGARQATVNGEPGAFVPQAGRTPEGKRLPEVDEVDIVLATIRTLESANQYGIGPNKARASGAYQYIPSTWNNYGGFSDAFLAPPEVQDPRARADVEYFLQRFNGNVSMIPVMWYYPRAATDTTWMDRVPNPAGGNRFTVREYQTKWLNLYQAYFDAFVRTYTPPPELGMASVVASDGRVVDPLAVLRAGLGAGACSTTAPPHQTTMAWAARAAIPTLPAAPVDGSYRSIVFPVLGPVTYSDGWGDCRDGCSRAHVGTDIIGVQMQPLLAAVDGTITRITPVAAGISGVAITITGPDGWRYNYFHVNNDTPGTDDGASLEAWEIAPGLGLGSLVRAGQVIGYMGNSGNAEASTTHLHFEIRDPAGVAQPSYASLKAAEAVQACSVGIGPWSTPTLGPDATANAKAIAAEEAPRPGRGSRCRSRSRRRRHRPSRTDHAGRRGPGARLRRPAGHRRSRDSRRRRAPRPSTSIR